MKNKGNVLNSLLIMLAGQFTLLHRLSRNMVLRVSFTSSMSKKVMQQLGLAVFLFPIIK
jgi:hypothetical protein